MMIKIYVTPQPHTRQLADPNHDSLPHGGGDETSLTNTRWHIKHGVSYVLEEAPHDFGHAPAIMRYALEMGYE